MKRILALAVLLAVLRPVSARGAAFASFTTKYNPGNAPRVHNIALAAAAINGVTIEPGEVFSYNGAVGPTISARGYRKARVVKDGRDYVDYGGGVCQVSTTLYNAALALNLEIIERHPHSKKVLYVPKGKDAATAYGGIDLKFRNTSGSRLQIVAFAENGSVTVELIQTG
jgi:vancomycin resistance protein YoaR